jgi:hypothetical protein
MWLTAQIHLSHDGKPLANQTLYSTIGEISTNEEGVLDIDHLVEYVISCDQEVYPEKLGLIYAPTNEIAHYVLVATQKSSTVDLREETPISRVQIQFTVNIPCRFFVSGYTSSKQMMVGDRLEVATIAKVNKITLVWYAPGYVPITKTVSVNTRDNKVSTIKAGKITLQPLPCRVEQVDVMTSYQISENSTVTVSYVKRQNQVWYYYCLQENQSNDIYCGSICVSPECFEQQSIVLEIYNIPDDTTSLTKQDAYVRIQAIPNYTLTQVEQKLVEQPQAPPESEQVNDLPKEEESKGILSSPTFLWIVKIGGAILAFLLLYRILWRKNPMHEFKKFS